MVPDCLARPATFLIVAFWALPSSAASLTPADAANHIGQNGTVCGVVGLTNVDAYTQFWPTVLDFGKPFPDQVFAAVIYGADRAKFGTQNTAPQACRRLRLVDYAVTVARLSVFDWRHRPDETSTDRKIREEGERLRRAFLWLDERRRHRWPA